MPRKPRNQIDSLFEKGVEKLLLSVIPSAPFIGKRLTRVVEHFDTGSPQSSFAQMEKELESAISIGMKNFDNAGLLNLLSHNLGKDQSVIRRMFVGLTRFLKKSAFADSKASLLLKLMHEADEKIPYVSLLVALPHSNAKEIMVSGSLASNYLQEAEQKKGEKKAYATLIALEKIAEPLYKPYLVSLVKLSYYKQGEKPPEIFDFGALVKTAYHRLSDYPGLVEPNVGWMRNSAAHNNYQYIPNEKALWMWDKKTPRTKILVDDLFAIVNNLAVISSLTMNRVAQLYLHREVLINAGLLDAMIKITKAELTGDALLVASIEREIAEKMRLRFKPLGDFISSSAI